MPDLGPARRAPEHRPGPLGRDHRRPAVRGARAGPGGRPEPMDRHAPAGPAADPAVRLPVLPGDGARPAPGAALSPRHQAGQPAGDRGRHAQDHRLRPGAGLRGDGGRAPRASRRLDPPGRAHRPVSRSSGPIRGIRSARSASGCVPRRPCPRVRTGSAPAVAARPPHSRRSRPAAGPWARTRLAPPTTVEKETQDYVSPLETSDPA